MTKSIELYGDSISGNCYKLQLVCAQLSIDHVWHELDILAGDTRTDAFLAMNPNGKSPLLKLNDEQFLPESNAILHYLARGSDLLPEAPLAMANVLSWMFFEQYSHEPYIAVARFIKVYLGNPADRQADLESKYPGGYQALQVMEGHLSKHNFFANDAYSIADIALYAYTHRAHEGGFSLDEYPQVRNWLARVEGQPGYVPMSNRH